MSKIHDEENIRILSNDGITDFSFYLGLKRGSAGIAK